MAYPLGRARRWTREEYDSLISQGLFDPDERVELLGGELVVREPQGSYHVTTVALVARALERAFGPGWTARQHGPLALDPESEPEPDLAVVPGEPIDCLEAHPTHPVLVVEVSDTSLGVDRERKGALYARAELADSWIVNLRDRCLEVHREPGTDEVRPHAWRYRSRRVLLPGDEIVPLAGRRPRSRQSRPRTAGLAPARSRSTSRRAP